MNVYCSIVRDKYVLNGQEFQIKNRSKRRYRNTKTITNWVHEAQGKSEEA